MGNAVGSLFRTLILCFTLSLFVDIGMGAQSDFRKSTAVRSPGNLIYRLFLHWFFRQGVTFSDYLPSVFFSKRWHGFNAK